ncbi:MAG TPA: tRNA (adenosine(37)-N6)-threonylcarbamoyltransferase complex ATPase subunit type 1 TsaE [Bdellovibrionota bacterium]|nr:tRNA (adenosine(37)-N6)-threonylcarbamoyltransferase complex ATPase subunit type 1 TsaE [Bdellovibrionota bacterium]
MSHGTPIQAQSLEDTQRLGVQLGELLKAGDVIGLVGPLGVGKTAFVGGMARGVGVNSEYAVTSPTFVFAHIYPGKLPLYHIDLYRVEKEKELEGLGLDEMIGGDGVAVIEWFDRFDRIWSGDRVEIEMAFGSSGRRQVEIRPFGTRGREIVSRWGSVS